MKLFFKAIAPVIVQVGNHLRQNLLSILTSTKYAAVILLLMLSLVFVPNAEAQNPTMTPQQVVEYALTLEKLEADFYRRANNAVQSGTLA